MSPREEIARARMQRAREALGEADLLIGALRWRGALNRLYYAAFYAARAVLATRDLDSSRHSGVIALFQQHFVKSGAVLPAAARTLPRAFEARQSSDYADSSDPTEEAVRALRTGRRDAREPCQRCRCEGAVACRCVIGSASSLEADGPVGTGWPIGSTTGLASSYAAMSVPEPSRILPLNALPRRVKPT
jgi:uncharacterized protein (UPF0332 family)